MTDTAPAKHATLTRMVLPDHTCPYGVKALKLLEDAGYTVDDRILHTREETDAFKAEHGLKTTPLIVIDGETIGGASDLAAWLEAHAA